VLDGEMIEGHPSWQKFFNRSTSRMVFKKGRWWKIKGKDVGSKNEGTKE